jgi:hypothetical protein
LPGIANKASYHKRCGRTISNCLTYHDKWVCHKWIKLSLEVGGP